MYGMACARLTAEGSRVTVLTFYTCDVQRPAISPEKASVLYFAFPGGGNTQH